MDSKKKTRNIFLINSIHGKTFFIIAILAIPLLLGFIMSQNNQDNYPNDFPIEEAEDIDSDLDGIFDSQDQFPNDKNEYVDTDKDGIGDNRDKDDDGDGWADEIELACSSNSSNFLSTPNDKDGDGICDILDPDFEGLLENFEFIGINRDFEKYHGDNHESYAINMTTWQMPHGGWEKWNEQSYQNSWDGISPLSFYVSNGTELGSLADQATTGELRYLSSIYPKITNYNNKSIIKSSFELGIDFIINSQHESGGWPQVYPDRTCNGCNYTSFMTYNDFVIPNALLLLHDIKERISPFDGEIVSNLNLSKINNSIDLGIDYVLKSQILSEGVFTIWGQQHDPYTYQSLPGRSYELPCKASAESAGVTIMLLNWKNKTPEINDAIWTSIQWFEKTAIYGYEFNQSNGTIMESPDSVLWFRYYNISDDQYFMAGRDGIKVYDLNDLTIERRTGYRWAFGWAQGIIEESSKVPTGSRSNFFI